MRQIKFRAWDGERMYDSDSVVVYLGRGFIEHESFDCKAIHIKKTTVKSLMQYTGLKDVNGVGIYDGDVITDHVGTGVIVWWQENAAFKTSYRLENKGQGKWFADYNLKGELESIEVIGNIHQNPELLE